MSGWQPGCRGDRVCADAMVLTCLKPRKNAPCFATGGVLLKFLEKLVLRTYFKPAAARRAAALSVRSQVNSGSSRPKWP